MQNKNILLGVTGGIAAYKSAALVRELKSRGANVRVVMTHSAQKFVTPLTFQALSGEPVHLDLLDTEAEAAMGHIELAKWADVLLVAPASAHFLAQYACGLAGDLLSTLCLATTAPLFVAPAMNQAMWKNAATQTNAALLKERGVHFIGPAEGLQACGDQGPGRMEEAEIIAEQLAVFLQSEARTPRLAGVRILITAGPTRELIDPVRYISNYSSGKMGFALAEAAAKQGAEVVLVHGPVSLPTPSGIRTVSVNSAEEMLEACLTIANSGVDIFMGSAAVADYRPLKTAKQKIKKTDEQVIVLELTKNPDIIATIARCQPKPFTVGFAAETQNIQAYASEKMQRKGLDMVIANDVSDPSIGFNSDDNAVVLISKTGQKAFEKTAKKSLALKLIAEVAEQYVNR